MATYKIEPTPDAIDPLTGKRTGEHDVLMLNNDGVWDWIGTFGSLKEARAEIREIRSDNSEGEWRRYQAGYAHACGYYD